MHKLMLCPLGILTCLLCFFSSAFCQRTQESCPLKLKNNSRVRGVAVTYRYQGNNTSNGSYQMQSQLDVKIKAPLLLKDRIKIIAGWNFGHYESIYQPSNSASELGIAAEHPQAEIPDALYENEFSLAAVYNSRIDQFWVFYVRGGFQGQKEISFGWDAENATISAAALWGKRVDDTKEWGIGLGVNYSAFSFAVLPTFMYKKNFTDKWGVEVFLPSEAKLRYNINPKSMLFAGFKNETFDFYLDNPEQDDSIIRLRRLFTDLQISYERQIKGWVWGFVSAGYQWNHSSDFLGLNPGTGDLSAFNKPFVEFGVFLSPSM